MIELDTSDRKEQRNFGLVMAGAIAVLGLIRWGLHWRGAEAMPELPYYYFAIAFAFAFFGVIAPKALKPLFDGWIAIAVVLNWIVTHIVLTVAFFLTVVPIGILMRIFGNDPLDRSLSDSATSYWQDAENQADDPERYTKQF